MKKKLTLLFLIVSAVCLQAQDSLRLSGHFKDNSRYAQVMMKKFGVGSFAIGGKKIENERFALNIPSDIEPGVYRFVYAMAEGEQYLDIIINGKEKEIAFTLDAKEASAFPVFSASEENKLWYAYLKKSTERLEKIYMLTQFINAYPNTKDNVVVAAISDWEKEKEAYLQDFEAFKTQTKTHYTWAYEMVANRPYYFADPRDDFRLQDYEKRENFWSHFDATNPKLMNTPLYTDHILNYLRYWMNPEMNFSDSEKTSGFKKSVDVIIKKFSGNEATKEFAYKYLTLGFKEIGEEDVLQYLDENYRDLAEQCFDEVEKSDFDQRMEGYTKMKAGNKAPNFSLAKNNNAKAKDLYGIKADQLLVVFWSSTCPHCLEEMPKVEEWAASQKGLKILAVSIDTNEDEYNNAKNKYPNMMHSCDFKGWDTEAAVKYFIAATPTFILLDKDKKIVGKYSGFNQVKNQFK